MPLGCLRHDPLLPVGHPTNQPPSWPAASTAHAAIAHATTGATALQAQRQRAAQGEDDGWLGRRARGVCHPPGQNVPPGGEQGAGPGAAGLHGDALPRPRPRPCPRGPRFPQVPYKPENMDLFKGSADPWKVSLESGRRGDAASGALGLPMIALPTPPPCE